MDCFTCRVCIRTSSMTSPDSPVRARCSKSASARGPETILLRGRTLDPEMLLKISCTSWESDHLAGARGRGTRTTRTQITHSEAGCGRRRREAGGGGGRCHPHFPYTQERTCSRSRSGTYVDFRQTDPPHFSPAFRSPLFGLPCCSRRPDRVARREASRWA